MRQNLSYGLAYQQSDSDVFPTIAPLPSAFRGFERDITKIGTGLLGGKVECLAAVSQSIHVAASLRPHLSSSVTVPHMYVIATDFFDGFMELNGFVGRDFSLMTDADISRIFATAALPGRLVGYLSEVLNEIQTPIAVRSSGLLETTLYIGGNSPFGARILPNCHADFHIRLEELKRAIRAVYASMFFSSSRLFVAQRGKELCDEKMAVFIQEIFGRKVGRRFFPDLSGKIISPARKRGCRGAEVPVVEAEPGLIWIDRSGASNSTVNPGLGYWAVNLDAPHIADDLMSEANCLISTASSTSDFGTESVDATCLLEVPTDELLHIAERIVGGRAEVLYATVGDLYTSRPVRTAVLKVSPAFESV